METVTLNPGQTVVLAGFQNTNDQTQVDSMGPASTWALGGNKSALSTQTVTVVVVTPYLVGR